MNVFLEVLDELTRVINGTFMNDLLAINKDFIRSFERFFETT
jgi:hypothetical protein